MKATENRFRTEAVHWTRKILNKPPAVLASAQRLAGEIRSIVGQGRFPPPAQGACRVAIVSSQGLNAIALSLDALLVMALRARGHEAAALICAEGLPSCEFNYRGTARAVPDHLRTAFSSSANARACDDCGTGAHAALSATGAPVFRMGDFASGETIEAALKLARTIPADEIRGYQYKGIAVGDHAFSSTLRSTWRGVVDLASADELFIYRRQLASAMVMVDRLGAFLDSYRPDKVIGVHGVYLMHGTMVDVCRQRGIAVDIFGVPYRKGTLLFSHGETYHRTMVTEPTALWDQDTLDESQQARLMEYLESKASGGRDNVNYHPNPISGRQEITDALGLDPAKPVVSLYTNVIWDAQIYYSFNAFENIFDWVYSTIAYFKDRPDLQLVIRVHPAESKGGFMTAQPITPEIRARFPHLPSNVFIVPPESDISSYTLAEMSQATLIYGTKMGLEIAYRGIPVIVAGETFNRGKGYTHDVESRAEYFDLLDRVTELPRNSPQMIQRALRFAYYFFFQKMMDFPLLGDNLYRAAREPDERFYTFASTDDLAPGSDRTLDIICDGIVGNTPFLLPIR